MSLHDHMKNAAERYRKETEQARLTAERQIKERLDKTEAWHNNILGAVRGLREEIRQRSHLVYKGRRIRWFGFDFNTYVDEWDLWTEGRSGSSGGVGNVGSPGSSTNHYKFRERTTTAIEGISRGYYFPEWDISIQDILMSDILDYRWLDIKYDDIGMPGKISLAHSAHHGTFSIIEDKIPQLYSAVNNYKLRRALKPLMTFKIP